MKSASFVKNIFTSYHRNKMQKRVLVDLVNNKQLNQKVINLYRMDRTNAGDFYSAPHHYFRELNISLDIYEFKSPHRAKTENWISLISNNALIIGGGGLFNRGSFEKGLRSIERLKEKDKQMVIWGAGHNSKNRKDFKKLSSYNIDLDNFGLAGTRDYSLSKNWVPCVSCLHPVFDKNYATKQETGLIFHKNTLKKKWITSKFRGLPVSSNTTDLENLAEFIGNSESIITDSYHAMYWAMLLGKKVVVIPNSSKFFDFKYQPVFSSFENCLKDVHKTEKYTGVLQECREINKSFAERVFNYLKI